ncbi:hypothetical protein O3P69_020371 [Scylla paramamosain]|uniref:Ionotropic glutamate receptor L-glutamate and glycine-binding domain-containing protein n=1 Tax=Scylla paramamosain TaxID=85552 RepID=A0AAW0TLI8_SCYPA
MFNGEYIWILLDIPLPGNLSESLRPGLLSLRPDYLRTPQRQLLVNFVKSSISVISEFFKETNMTSSAAMLSPSAPTQCQVPYRNLSTSQFELHRQLKEKLESSRISQRSLPGVTPFFHVENLVKTGASTQWKRVGYINGSEVQINAIFWPGRGYKGVSEQNKRLRVALAEAPPFVMTSSLIENATCLLGIICLRVFSPEVAATFADMEREVVNASRGYEVVCCSGLSVDLMINVATDLEIELQVYLVMDGTFGAPRTSGWTGIVGDLLDGSADLSFAPLSVTAQRARHLDFSDPYFFSSISILSSTNAAASSRCEPRHKEEGRKETCIDDSRRRHRRSVQCQVSLSCTSCFLSPWCQLEQLHVIPRRFQAPRSSPAAASVRRTDEWHRPLGVLKSVHYRADMTKTKPASRLDVSGRKGLRLPNCAAKRYKLGREGRHGLSFGAQGCQATSRDREIRAAGDED